MKTEQRVPDSTNEKIVWLKRYGVKLAMTWEADASGTDGWMVEWTRTDGRLDRVGGATLDFVLDSLIVNAERP